MTCYFMKGPYIAIWIPVIDTLFYLLSNKKGTARSDSEAASHSRASLQMTESHSEHAAVKEGQKQFSICMFGFPKCQRLLTSVCYRFSAPAERWQQQLNVFGTVCFFKDGSWCFLFSYSIVQLLSRSLLTICRIYLSNESQAPQRHTQRFNRPPLELEAVAGIRWLPVTEMWAAFVPLYNQFWQVLIPIFYWSTREMCGSETWVNE